MSLDVKLEMEIIYETMFLQRLHQPDIAFISRQNVHVSFLFLFRYFLLVRLYSATGYSFIGNTNPCASLLGLKNVSLLYVAHVCICDFKYML